MDFLNNATFRRALAAVVMVGLPFVNQALSKVGLSVSSDQVIVGMLGVLTYIVQSVANTIHARAVGAADTVVPDVGAAVAVLNTTPGAKP